MARVSCAFVSIYSDEISRNILITMIKKKEIGLIFECSSRQSRGPLMFGHLDFQLAASKRGPRTKIVRAKDRSPLRPFMQTEKAIHSPIVVQVFPDGRPKVLFGDQVSEHSQNTRRLAIRYHVEHAFDFFGRPHRPGDRRSGVLVLRQRFLVHFDHKHLFHRPTGGHL